MVLFDQTEETNLRIKQVAQIQYIFSAQPRWVKEVVQADKGDPLVGSQAGG